VILASLLLAVELNGQQLSRGTEVLVTEPQACLVALDSLRAQVKPKALLDVTHDGRTYQQLSGPQAQCQIDESAGVARLNVAADLLVPKPLIIGQAIRSDQAVTLINQPSDRIHTMPSLALDLLAGTTAQTIGLTASHGNTQLFAQQSRGLANARPSWSSETLFSSGAALTLGHQSLGTGLLNTPVSTTGVGFSSRALPLRQTQTHANLVLQSPARLRFLDRNGNTLYSSNLLTTGQYQVSGILGSPGPGLLEVEVLGADGQRQIVGLPWTNSPLLLGPTEQLIDAFVGQELMQLRIQRGISITESIRLQGEWVSSALNLSAGPSSTASTPSPANRLMAGLSSRRWSRWLISADVGLTCRTSNCQAEHRLQSIYRRDRSLQISLEEQGSAGRHLGLSMSNAGGHQVNLSLGQSSSGRLQAFASWQQRLGKAAQLQLQWRRSAEAGHGILLSLHLPLDTRYTSDLSLQTNSTSRPSLQAALHRRPEGEYGSSVSLTRREGPSPHQAIDLRQEASIGSLSLSARQFGSLRQIQGQLASRLWMTPEGLTLGRLSDANLVVHTTGLAAASMRQNQQPEQRADARGRIWFANAPSWSTPDYRISAKSLPFYIDWQGGQVSLPTTKRRAYRVDHRQAWRLQLSSRLNLPLTQLANLREIRQRNGRSVSFSPDGYVDLGRPDELPLLVVSKDGAQWQCGHAKVQPNENGELLLDCIVESQPPEGITPRPSQRPLLEAQTSEPPPSSG
jgi:hypothetical protein